MSTPSSRRYRLSTIVQVAGMMMLSAVVLAAARIEDDRPPNIIIILADDLGYGDVGCYAAAKIPTPNIDRLARNAVRFDRAYSHAPWTLPSVASLLTSRYPVQHGAGGHVPDFRVLSKQAVTLAEVFQQAGKATHAIVNVLFLT